MQEDLIETIWDQDRGAAPLSRDELARALRPRVTRGRRSLAGHIGAYLGVLLITLVLGGINIAGYWPNPTMRAVQIALVALTASFAVHGMRLFADAGLVDRPDDSLLETVRRRLGFLGPRYEVWMWMASLSVLLLSFSINTLIDNVDGQYPINHPVVFVGIQVAVVLVMYASLKLTTLPIVRELEAMLGDLEDQLLERTPGVDRWKHGLRRWQIMLALLLGALALLGVWAFFKMSSA